MWSDANEAKQAVDLLVKWNDIDVEDALELLGKDFQNVNVRRYAVLQLKKANDSVCILKKKKKKKKKKITNIYNIFIYKSIVLYCDTGFTIVFITISSSFKI